MRTRAYVLVGIAIAILASLYFWKSPQATTDTPKPSKEPETVLNSAVPQGQARTSVSNATDEASRGSTKSKLVVEASASSATSITGRSSVGNLYTKYQDAMTSAVAGSGAAAVFSAAICANYVAGGSTDLRELSPAVIAALQPHISANIEESRRNAAERLRESCRGFSKDDITDKILAAHSKSVKEGFGFLKHVNASSISPTQYDLALTKLLTWPDKYVDVLSVNIVWLAQGLKATYGDAKLSDSEAFFVTQRALCTLGADCAAGSVSTLDYCVNTGVCTGKNFQDSLSIGAQISGYDLAKIDQLSDGIAATIRRGDRSALKF